MGIIFDSVPVGSLITLSPEERSRYVDLVFQLPEKARGLLFAPKTGAFTRGLVKGYNLPETRASVVALIVLRIAVGEKSAEQLPSLLSTELQLPNDKAQKMAREIEEDLFGPVMKELEQYWRRQKSTPGPANEKEVTTDKASEAGARNVLNLKEQKKPPAPPPMPT